MGLASHPFEYFVSAFLIVDGRSMFSLEQPVRMGSRWFDITCSCQKEPLRTIVSLMIENSIIKLRKVYDVTVCRVAHQLLTPEHV